MKKVQFPLTISEGSAVVKIYKADTKIGRKNYVAYLVRYHLQGEPVQRKFSKFEGAGPEKAALPHAQQVARKINQGTASLRLMSVDDQHSYLRAKEILKPYNKTVEQSATEHVEILKESKGVHPIVAMHYYHRNHPADFVDKKLSDVITEMIAEKKADGRSGDWIRALDVRLGKLKKKFGGNINELNGVKIDEWLRSLKLAPKTRCHYRGAISALISFAKSKKYLPKDFSELDYIKTAKTGSTEEIEIYTPDEIEKLLKSSSGSLFLYIAFGAFAGLRPSEAARLDWSRVSNDGIVVHGKHPRDPKRRIAPMLEPLIELIKGQRKTSGKIWPAKKESPTNKQLVLLTKRSGVKWKKNALRHSFISYRLAIIKDASQIESECGTSKERIDGNYRQIVTEAGQMVNESLAKKYFEVYKTITNSEQVTK